MEVSGVGGGTPPAPKRPRQGDSLFGAGCSGFPQNGLPPPVFVHPAACEVLPVRAEVRRLLCGYDVHVEGSYSEADLDCPVCQSPAVEGVMLTGCGHTFHEDCMKAVLQLSQSCPVCQMPAPRLSLRRIAEVPAARYLRNALLMLPVRCPQGCAAQAFPWERLHHHIRDECPATQVQCACGAIMSRSLCEAHHQVCPAACVECELCGHRTARADWGRHAHECSHFPFTCKWCHASLMRSNLESHLRNECTAKVPMSLFLRVCDRAREGRSVFYAPMIAAYAHALAETLAGSSSDESAAKLEGQLMQEAERVGRPVQGDQWKRALREECADYAVYVSCFKHVQIFVKGTRTVTLQVHLDDTVGHMLYLLNSKTRGHIRGRDLTVAGRGLYREDASLREYGVQQESTLYTRTLTSF